MLRAVVLIAIFMPSAAAPQSRAELSKREKQRRKANGSEETIVKAYTDADISNDSDDAGADGESSGSGAPVQDVQDASDSSDLDAWLGDKDADKDAWRVRLADYERRFAEEKQRLAMLRRIEAQCQSDAMPVGIVDQPWGTEQVQVTWGAGQMTCENLPGMIETALSTIKSIEVECATDARRHFIPPLEAKLH